ncbi:Vacuolar-sorting protein SNF7 [Smittium mucronatum]|uniref:Vacuolar-sorting protein SNF7 n=1 Tax=Smittium mucronatum TaxID=133383 RepID=A0A1R0GUV9_9FUNG|nr:Vacuolar-sorting protein SNF7 [Smittium mucronatum]
MAALKRKKLLEEQLDKISGSRMTLETQIFAIESANVNLETMNAMRKGADAMKNIHKNMNIDKVDQTMDEIREQMDLANEVSAAISQPELLGMSSNESELLEELELLEQEQLDKQLLNAERPPVSAIKPPVKQVVAPKTEEEEEEDAELAELRESMGMMN